MYGYSFSFWDTKNLGVASMIITVSRWDTARWDEGTWG